MSLSVFARLFLIAGVVLIMIGGLLTLADRLEIPWGHLPGDIRIERGNFSSIFALGSSLLLSVVLTVLFNLIIRLLNR